MIEKLILERVENRTVTPQITPFVLIWIRVWKTRTTPTTYIFSFRIHEVRCLSISECVYHVLYHYLYHVLVISVHFSHNKPHYEVISFTIVLKTIKPFLLTEREVCTEKISDWDLGVIFYVQAEQARPISRLLYGSLFLIWLSRN